MNLLIIFVIFIIILQFVLFTKNVRLISKLKKVLTGDFSTNTTSLENVTIIRYQTKEANDKVTENIENSINTYLRKNKGAVSDFSLIKDIVERNCDSLEAEIASQTPLPLYLGLMGTVAGIILGLFTITLNGGFSQIDKVIEILMSDVAIAMVASFMGICLTTLSLWKSKQCKVTIEANKNRFYTWFQTNLLPVISKNAVSAITLLQKNLTRFNESFTGTVDRLEDKLGDVGDLYSAQIEILEKIETIDIKKMAVANVKILSALDGSIGSLDKFSQYMCSITEYLTAVKELNSKLDEHLERTETLGVVSDFYKAQMKEIGLRQDAIRSAVLSVDDVMKSALAALKVNSENGLKSMQEAFVNQMMTMQEMISKQTEQLTIQLGQMPQLLQRLDAISSIPAKLDKLIDRIDASNNNLSKQISQTLKSIPMSRGDHGVKIIQSSGGDTDKHNPLLKRITFGTVVVIAFVCIANLIVNTLSYGSLREKVQDNTNVVLPDTIDSIASKSHGNLDSATKLDSLLHYDSLMRKSKAHKINNRQKEDRHEVSKRNYNEKR